MPARSKAQFRWMFATDQPFAERWARQTTFRRLPARVTTKATEEPAAPTGNAPANTGTPGKRTPSERARLAALARWGKYKGKGAGKPKGKGRKPAQTPEAKEAARRQAALDNRAKVAGEMGISSEDQASIDALAMGKPPGDTAALVKAGIVELGKDGTPRLSAAGRAFYNAAGRGDAGAAGDALSRGRDKVTPDAKPEAEAEKPKGGGGGGGKEKPTEDEKARAKAEAAQQKLQATRSALRQQMADNDSGLSPSGFDAFTSFADGGSLDDGPAAQLADMGLIEGDPPRLTEAGRGARNAINRGDYRGAVDAIGRGTDRKKTAQERERAKADKETEATAKPKQTKRTTERRGTTVITTRETKAADSYTPPDAARSNAKRGLALRKQWGRGGTAVGVARARDLSNGRALPYRTVARMAAFNRHRGYALDGRKEPDGGPSAAYIAWLLWGGTTGVDWARGITGAKETKMQTESQDSAGGVLTGRPRFRKRRTDMTAAATKAGARHNRTDNEIIKGVVVKASGILDDMTALGYVAEDAPPAMKAIDYASICQRVSHAVHEALEEAEELDDEGEGMGMPLKAPEASCEVLVYDEYAVACLDDKDIKIGYTLDDAGEVELDEPGEWSLVTWDVEEVGDYEDSVKMLSDGRIGGYAVRFGSADEPDLSEMRDYFTKSTDFWLDAWNTRPMLYHHAQDEATKAAPVVGTWTGASVDSVGVWLEGQLNKAHRYHAAIKELVQRGMLKLSSDSAPHLVVRERQPNGTNEIKRWPMLAASLTPTPAEPRLLPIGHIKALYAEAGLLPPVEIDDSPEATDADEPVEMAPDAIKTGDDERARRLRTTVDLLLLEAA